MNISEKNSKNLNFDFKPILLEVKKCWPEQKGYKKFNFYNFQRIKISIYFEISIKK